MAGAFPTPGTWATVDDLPAEATPELQATVGPQLVALGLSLASTVLYNLTGQRWPGQRTRTVWPCPCTCRARRRSDCGCGPVCSLDLGYPVASVEQVAIDGEVVPADAYEVQSERNLVWLGSPDTDRTCWPTVQDLDAAEGEAGTWSVTFTEGRPVPSDARAMAGRLGWELALLMAPGSAQQACRISPKTVAATRRGASQQEVDPAKMIELGATGLREVDLWLQAIARGRRTRGARVRVPGGRGHRPHPTR